MSGIIISQISAYSPSNIVSNNDLSEFIDTNDEWIFSRTGIKNRRISTGENTSDLCTRVCRELLEKENMNPADLDLIIVATISPDYLIPSVACLVQANVDAVNAVAFDINAACTGFVYACSVAEKMMRSGGYKTAVVIGGEVISKILDWSERGTCCLFGDGAGGVLLKQGERNFLLCEKLGADGKRANMLRAKSMPVVNEWTDQKDSEIFYMDGRGIFDFTAKAVPENLMSVLNNSGLSLDDIHLIIPHQANSRIIEYMARKLNVSLDKFCFNIREHGNTSSATIPIALAELLAEQKISIGSGQKLLLTGFGGGLTWGSMIIEI